MTKLSMLKTFAPALALAVAVLPGCGGGGEDKAAAPAESAPAAAAAPAADTSQTGSIKGAVTLAAVTDPDTAIKMDADPVCAGLHSSPVETQTIAGGAGQLANVLVYIKTPGVTGKAPAEPLVLKQEGCIYHPHVAAVVVGQPLKIINSDPTLHNVHALAKSNTEFNQAQPFQNMELEKKFDKPEMAISVKCDVHPWMQSYLSVLPHPYFAVTGEDGSFTINGVPAGSYEVEAWHESLGTKTGQVTVTAGGAADLSFAFGG